MPSVLLTCFFTANDVAGVAAEKPKIERLRRFDAVRGEHRRSDLATGATRSALLRLTAGVAYAEFALTIPASMGEDRGEVAFRVSAAAMYAEAADAVVVQRVLVVCLAGRRWC